MNFGKLKSKFKQSFGRNDITDQEIEDYIQFGIRRIQRTLRIPPMEKIVPYTNVSNELVIPGDFLDVANVYMTDGSSVIQKADIRTFMASPESGTQPTIYKRFDDCLKFRPAAPGVDITLHYYASFPELTLDTDTNKLSELAPDLIVAAALTYACVDYIDERLTTYVQQFGTFMEELDVQAKDVELFNGVMANPYPEAEY